MSWIKVTDELPKVSYGSHRMLIFTKCKTGMHNCVAFDWPYPCCAMNIAYYSGNGKWHWSSDQKEYITQEVTHWMPLPMPPEENI